MDNEKKYIDMDKAVDELEKYNIENCPEYMRGWAAKLIEAVAADFRDIILELPAADVAEVKRGHWICHGTIIKVPLPTMVFECSNCSRTVEILEANAHTLSEEYPYCNCGTRMDGNNNA